MKDLSNLKDYSKKINLFTSENYFNFLDKEKSIVRIGEFLNELYFSYPSDSPLILKINASLKKYCEEDYLYDMRKKLQKTGNIF